MRSFWYKSLIAMWLQALMFAAGAAVASAQDGEEPTAKPAGEAFLEQLQERDSVLIADQLRYGFELDDYRAGTGLLLPDWSENFCEGVQVLSPWKLDTVKVLKGKKKEPQVMLLRGSVTITSFEEGEYELPPVRLVRVSPEGVPDTLEFSARKLSVRTIPVDTATYQVHDIKDQVRYPIQFKEVLPYLAGALLLAAIIAVAVWLTRKYFSHKSGSGAGDEPAHIVALRKLDKFRGEKFWMPDKQKTFYSGVTDALREYLAARYDIGAMEMTTAEIFDALKPKEIPSELYGELKELFERADFVKFAKYVAKNEENATVVPLAVRFVTATYQEVLDSEAKEV